jgi:hypothetical protein
MALPAVVSQQRTNRSLEELFLGRFLRSQPLGQCERNGSEEKELS